MGNSHLGHLRAEDTDAGWEAAHMVSLNPEETAQQGAPARHTECPTAISTQAGVSETCQNIFNTHVKKFRLGDS